MNKFEIYELLKSRNMWHEITEHKAVYNMAEVAELEMPYPEADAKNLFVRDDKKRTYYLISVKGDKRVNLKEFKQMHGTRNLSFASENDLMNIMGLIPGAVTPLGVLNDTELKVKVYIDRDLCDEEQEMRSQENESVDCSSMIGVHPNDNTATVWMKTADLIDIIREHGNEVKIVEI